MVLRSFYYGVDNVIVTITKEDKQNVDSMTLKTNFGVAANVGDEINFYDENSALAFAGYIENKTTTGQLVLECEDYGSVLKRSITNKIFIDYLAEEIIEEVVTNAGLTYVSSIVTTEIIPTYTANKKNSQEIVQELAEKLLANYMTDVSKNFTLELEGGVTTTKTIDNVKGSIDGSWDENLSEVVNNIYVEGDSRSIFNKERLFSGTGTQTEFSLSEIPVDIKIEFPVGTLLTGYVEGQTTGDYQIIREQKKIIFDVAPTSGTDNIFVSFSYSVPVSIRRRSKSSIDLYGERSNIVRKNWILSRNDARDYANYVIQNFSNPLVSSSWNILSQTEVNDWQNYFPNQQIYVDDTLRGFSDFYIIRKVTRKYGLGVALKITVGSPELNIALYDKQVTDRIRQLEQNDENSTILNEDEFISEDITLQFDTDITSIERITFPTDTFYMSEDENEPRSQMLDSGLGPTMREVSSESFYLSRDSTSSHNQMTRDDSGPVMMRIPNTVITYDVSTNISAINILYMNLAKTNFITQLTTDITYIGVGDDDTTPLISDTTLGNETYIDALFDPISSTSNSVSMTMFMDVLENNGNSIKECGVFDASTSGNMFSHNLTNIISKDGDTEVFIEIQYNIAINNLTL